MPRHDLISKIVKTMVFVDKIEDAIELVKYLYSRLLNRVRNGNQASVVIRSFTFNLDTNTRTKNIKNLQHGNAQIYICMECASISINIPDIMQVV